MEEHNLLVTVDIEDWYHIPSVCGSPFSVYRNVDEFFENWNDRYDYLTSPTRRVLDMLGKLGVKATFFIVADVIEHYPGLVESIAEEGHEIGCHGLSHACKIHPKTKKALIEEDIFEKRTLMAKKALEGLSHEKVVGYRSPNALVAGWMLDRLERIGFKYDSSVCVNSLYNKTDSSLDGVSSTPYLPELSSLNPSDDRDFIEFPWAYYEARGIKVPTSGGPMLRFLGAQAILRGLKQSLKRGDTVFYFHPIDISSQRFPQIGKGRPMYWAGKGERIEKKIMYILKNLDGVSKARLKDVTELHGY
jgi:peptidoglycan/xylan/chitin deacetylase (PgdA/CDA1 family)